MLETVDFKKKALSKEEYKIQRKELLKRLVVLQQKARSENVGLVVLFEGWNGSGKGSRISDLMYNLDARATNVYVTPDIIVEDSDEFAGYKNGVSGYYPDMQQFWNALGMRGTITFYDRGWYAAAAQNLLYDRFGTLQITKDDVEKHKADKVLVGLKPYLSSAAYFERQLVDAGYIVVKFFLHISQEEQRKRLMKLESCDDTKWRVTDRELAVMDNYQQAYYLYDNLLERSDFDYAPWHVLNAEDKRSTNLEITRTLVEMLDEVLSRDKDAAALAAAQKAQANSAGAAASQGEEPKDEALIRALAEEEALRCSRLAPKYSRFPQSKTVPDLEKVDHSLALDEEKYRKELKKQQERFSKLEMEMYLKRIPLVIMYEGWDAAGKGGNIKRIAQALDARAYTIFPSPAPTKVELLHPHLWRYWTRLPKAGHVGIYDRSWYGRVLVERVEGFASDEEWARAYDEINEFEHDLVDWGALVLKFWVEISPEEQLNRFNARAADPDKQWKLTDEDWRNREKYPQYKAAVEDMFRLTSTEFAPWIILESDDKMYARIKALKIINEALEERLRKG